jgi:putative redox protein
MNRKRLKFPGAFGDELVGRLELPDAGEPAAYALFAHCFTCSKDLKAAGWISRALVERGVAVFRFDFTGIGESEGDFADTDFSSNLDDLEAAASFLREEHRAPKILIGHSLGGAAVLAAAGRIPEAEAVATIGAPSDTAHLRETLVRQAPELEERGEAEVRLGPRSFRIKKQLLEDLERDHVDEAIGNLGRPLLIFHSPVDTIVGIDHARRIYEAAKHPKSFVSLDDAHHLLTDERDARYVGEVLAAWAGRYVTLEDVPAESGADGAAAEADQAPGEGQVVVTGGPEGFTQDVRSRGHRYQADEPESYGGADRGPSPYELLLAGLGACTSMTLRMYADRKQWPLDGVRVELDHDRVHADDCDECTDEQREGGGKIDYISRRIEIDGDLDGEQRKRLMEIADRCPVHRTLTGEIHIQSEEV